MPYITRHQRKQSFRKKLRLFLILAALIAVIVLALAIYIKITAGQKKLPHNSNLFDLSAVPAFSGNPYTEINNNLPYFTDEDLNQAKTEAFENYSELDGLGRCGVAYANICKELLPTEERGTIGQIKPSGWQQAKYPGIVDSDPPYLYNRCHLIAYCLAGENANEKNLITGTRYMNVRGMLSFEEKVVRYVEKTGNHVLYRVTPVFEGNNLLASGVLLEGYSVEDKGKGICFCVYCYNVQPGVVIDYETGNSIIEN